MSKKSIVKIQCTTFILTFWSKQKRTQETLKTYIYEDLAICFTRYVCIKSRKVLSLDYHNLIGRIKEHKGKTTDG